MPTDLHSLSPALPSISFITVCRNAEDSIARTVESVVSQKLPGDEYLVIDGASIDGTLDILKRMDGIDLLISEPDQGISDAFNKGIKHATREIVSLVNADDRLIPGAAGDVRQLFVNDPSLDVIHGDVILMYGDTAVKRIKPSRFWWEPWRLVLFNHPATFVRRSVYGRHGGFNTSFRVAMDVELFFRWVSCGVRICYFPVPLVCMQQGGVSGQFAALGYREFRDAAVLHGHSRLLAWLQFGCKLMASRMLRFM